MSEQTTMVGWGVADVQSAPDGSKALVMVEIQPNSGNVRILPLSAEAALDLSRKLSPAPNIALASPADVAALGRTK